MIVRHPFIGLLAGLLIGIGIALILVQLAIVPFGSWTVVVFVAGFAVIGLVFALVIPVRGAPMPAAADPYQAPAAPPQSGEPKREEPPEPHA